MRTYDEYYRIMSLWESGNYGKNEIARKTGIPRSTVKNCIKRFRTVKGLEAYRKENISKFGKAGLLRVLKDPKDPRSIHADYAYLLGLYLGDGHISLSKGHRAYRLRISLSRKYPGIIQRCLDAIDALLPDNKVGYLNRSGHIDVSSYYKHWSLVLPQDGDGMKHERRIILKTGSNALSIIIYSNSSPACITAMVAAPLIASITVNIPATCSATNPMTSANSFQIQSRNSA